MLCVMLLHRILDAFLQFSDFFVYGFAGYAGYLTKTVQFMQWNQLCRSKSVTVLRDTWCLLNLASDWLLQNNPLLLLACYCRYVQVKLVTIIGMNFWTWQSSFKPATLHKTHTELIKLVNCIFRYFLWILYIQDDLINPHVVQCISSYRSFNVK